MATVNEVLERMKAEREVYLNRLNTLREHYGFVQSQIEKQFEPFDELLETVKNETVEKQIEFMSNKYMLLIKEKENANL
jgi:hypothetical protein